MSGAVLFGADEVALVDFASRASPLTLDFQVAARPASDGGVRFDLERKGTSEEIVVGGLGERLAEGTEPDLVGDLIDRFFALVEERALLRSRPAQLLYPPWLGPAARGRLRRAARQAGLSLGDELERGLALLVARIRRRHDRPSDGGWVIADRCGSDLDLYLIDDSEGALGRELCLRGYQRLRGLFGEFYSTRRGEALVRLREPVEALPAASRWLATDPAALDLLGGSREVELESWAAAWALTDDATEGAALVLARRPRHWLFVGDQRLEPLASDAASPLTRHERLYRIPHPPPQVLEIALRTGYGPSLSETYRLASLRLRRGGDYRALEGWLLVTAEVDQRHSGFLRVEIVQGGATSVNRTVTLDAERDDE